MTSRKFDLNGWYEIKDNPLSKAGVFEYLGSSIGAPNPDKIYKVLRPESELSNPKCLESFKLVPWVINHDMLGEGELPAERKGIQGIVGENIKYEDGMIKGNIKVFSDHLASLIDSGMSELSLGYKCKYQPSPGVYNGEHYDYIQTNIRGNHLATVEEGRMGPEVAVMDQSTVTFDSREFQKMATEKKPRPKKVVDSTGQDEHMNDETMDEEEMDENGGGEMTISEMAAAIKSMMPMMAEMEKIKEMLNGNGGEETTMEGEYEEEMDMEEEPEDEMEEESEDEKPDNSNSGMDKKVASLVRAAEKRLKKQLNQKAETAMDTKSLLQKISERDYMAQRVTRFVGAFDHREMTTEEVARYAVKKLSIPCQAGSEVTAVEAYLHDRKPLKLVAHSSGQDTKDTNPVDSLFMGG